MAEELTDECIDQIWAEAYQLYKNGEPIHITDKNEKTSESIDITAFLATTFYVVIYYNVVSIK